MNIRFHDSALEKYYYSDADEYKGKLPFAKDILVRYQKRVKLLDKADSLSEIGRNKGLNLEKLIGDLKDFHSIRINDQYRIIFKLVEEKGEVTIQIIEIHAISKHYE